MVPPQALRDMQFGWKSVLFMMGLWSVMVASAYAIGRSIDAKAKARELERIHRHKEEQG